MNEVKPVDPGQTNKKLEIVRRSKKQGEQGQPSKEWSVVGEFWGAIETLGGFELERLSKQFPSCSHRIKANYCRELDALHPRDQLRFQQTFFDIQHVENVNFENVRVEILVNQMVTRKT